jgi:hypothetical protein
MFWRLIRYGAFIPLAYCATLPTVPVANADRPSAIDATRSERVLLQHLFARGNTKTYQLVATQSIAPVARDNTPTDVRMSLTFSQEVQNVAPDGSATVGTTLSDPSLDTDLQNRRVFEATWARLRGLRTTTRLQSDGTMLENLGGGTSDFGALDPSGTVVDLLTMTRVEFPREPVAIGESWLQTIPLSVSTADGSIMATAAARYTLAGYAPFAGREVAVIDAIYDTTIEGAISFSNQAREVLIGRGHGSGYLLFDVRAGEVLQVGVNNGVVLTRTDISGGRATFTSQMAATVTSVSAGSVEGSGSGASP